MARLKKNVKDVYERILDKQSEIAQKEEELKKLNDELSALNNERDELQKSQLFSMMQEKGLTIDDALKMLSK